MAFLEENRDRMDRMDRMTKWGIKNCKRRLAWRIQRDKGCDGLTNAGWGAHCDLWTIFRRMTVRRRSAQSWHGDANGFVKQDFGRKGCRLGRFGFFTGFGGAFSRFLASRRARWKGGGWVEDEFSGPFGANFSLPFAGWTGTIRGQIYGHTRCLHGNHVQALAMG